MGKGIKTRNIAEKGIKAIDKAAVASERMKEAYIRTRDNADHSLYAAESSPGEYASDRLSSGVDSVTHEAIHFPANAMVIITAATFRASPEPNSTRRSIIIPTPIRK